MGNNSSSANKTIIPSSEMPTWEDLQGILKEASPKTTPKKVLTFYRDSNGWCPFCERVWLALEIKGIPYEERLITLIDPPSWFHDMVPTGRVPAILIYDEQSDKSSLPDQRTLIWESETILKALDTLFPETVPLMSLDIPKFEEGKALIEKVKAKGTAYAGFPPSTSIKDEDTAKQKKEFESVLDELDAFIAANGGPFILGSKVSGVDCLITSWFERWYYQLPITLGVNIMEGRPNLLKWFREGMGTLDAYVNRVAGDQYSWTAVLHFLLTQFGEKNKEGADAPQIVATKEKVNATALQLTSSFDLERTEWAIPDGTSLSSQEVARRAAAKILSNYTRIVEDCTYDKTPKTQTHIARASSQKNADIALRAVVASLLHDENTVGPVLGSKEEAEDAAKALTTIANRLCVPRDMGAPSAAALRRVLMKTSKKILEVN